MKQGGQPISKRVDDFLASVQQARRGSLIFALDATVSRERTWDAAASLTAKMFQEVSIVGVLSMQLVYYRGVRDHGGECKASRWTNDPVTLAPLMSKITCISGQTQIELILKHAIRESSQRKVNALVFVGDAVEEERDVLVESATRLAALITPVFVFQEGADYFAQQCFMEIVRITHGAYFKFDSNCLQPLADTLGVIAKFAIGGATALPPQERKLLGLT